MNILHKQEQYKQLLFSLMSIVFFGFCLRMWGLGDQPLWTDEGHSWFKSTLPWSVIMDNMASKDVHPPFYYILLSLIGAQNNEINLRLPSVLFSIGSVGIVWFMGLISENLKTASIASLLIAISPLHIQYSQEVRHYAAFEFFSSLSCLGLLIFIKQWCDPFLNSRFRSDSDNYIFYKKAMLPACLVVFGTAASLWTSNTSVFLLLAINLTVLLIFLKVHSESRLIFLKIWFFYQALILIIWSFWVPSLIHQSNYDSWITDKGFDSLYNVVNDFWAYFIYSYRPFFTLFFITLVTLGISRTKNKNYAYALASLVVIPLISNLVVSYWSPILVTRSLIWVSLPLFVLIAIGLSSIKNKYFFYLSLIFVVLIQFQGLWIYWNDFSKERWDLVIQYLHNNKKLGDAVVLSPPWVSDAFEYYWRKHYKDQTYTIADPNDEKLVFKLKDQHRTLWFIGAHQAGFEGSLAQSLKTNMSCNIQIKFDSYGFKNQCRYCLYIMHCE
jgi:uncharacterized membrane protein